MQWVATKPVALNCQALHTDAFDMTFKASVNTQALLGYTSPSVHYVTRYGPQEHNGPYVGAYNNAAHDNSPEGKEFQVFFLIIINEQPTGSRYPGCLSLRKSFICVAKAAYK